MLQGQKPLEFTDFSGGITDHILQGDPRRYQYADNFWITNDKKLIERDAIVPYNYEDGYSLDDQIGYRVGSMFSFFSDTVLMARQGRTIWTVLPGDTSWSQITGMDGHEALQGGDYYSQVSYGEFQQQIFFTSDGDSDDDGISPSKIFKDDTGNWVARSVGLPRAWVGPNFTNQSLLAKCIANANALRNSFIDHFGDAKNPTFITQSLFSFATDNGVNIHGNIDKYSLCYLVAQSFVPADPQGAPSPLPTPANDATNEATLYTLIAALNSAFSNHIADGIRGTGSNAATVRYYHYVIAHNLGMYLYAGPNASINNTSAAITLEEAATQLDDLLMKWNWHRKGVWNHSVKNDPNQFDIYDPGVTKIGTVDLETNNFPTVTPDWGDLYGWVNNLRFLYNSHVLNINPSTQFPNTITGHTMKDNYMGATQNIANGYQCRLDECQTLEEMYLLIYWLRALYRTHYDDAAAPVEHVNVRMTCTAGAKTVTSVIRTDTGAAYTIPVGSLVWCDTPASPTSPFAAVANGQDGSGLYRAAFVTVSASGTATLDRAATTSTNYFGTSSRTIYHITRLAVNPWTTVNSSTGLEVPEDQISGMTLGTDLLGWMDLATEFFDAFAQHFQRDTIHVGAVGVQGPVWWYQIGSTVPYPNLINPKVTTASYALFFSYPYKVGINGIEYLTLGNPILSDSLQIATSYPVGYVIPDQINYTIGVNQNTVNDVSGGANALYPILTTRVNTLSGLPVLTNNLNTNYDLSKIKLQIYRTLDGGNAYFKVGEVDNGTTTFVDNVNDTVAQPGEAALEDNEPIYTSGGVVGYDQPPQCKFMHILDGTAYYGAITDTGQFFPNRIGHSVQGAPDASPATFYDDLDDDLTGISSTRNNVIALCKSSIYRMEGGFNELGQGQLTHEKISDEVGCLNSSSIVKTEIGVFFAGTGGFYYTDGYQIMKISLEIDLTYQKFTSDASQARSLYGTYDRDNRRIYWCVKNSPTSPDNQMAYIFYLNFGVKPSGVFTTISNGLIFQPSSIVFHKGIGYFGDARGYLMKFDPDNKWDALVDTNFTPFNWRTIHIPFNYTSLAVDMGTIYNRKWLTKVHFIGQNHGNMSMQPYALRDLNQTGQGAVPLAPINYNENIWWGLPTCIWGDPAAIWKTDGKMDVWRRFPRNTLRSDFMQLQLLPAEVCVYASSVDYPEFAFAETSSLGGGLSIAEIITPAGYTDIVWPLDSIGYVLKLDYDNYETEYEIQGITDANKTLLLIDSANQIPTITAPGVKWEIWGVKKEQRATITSFVIHYGYLGDENQAYPGQFSNSGPGNGGENPS